MDTKQTWISFVPFQVNRSNRSILIEPTDSFLFADMIPQSRQGMMSIMNLDFLSVRGIDINSSVVQATLILTQERNFISGRVYFDSVDVRYVRN